MLIITVGGILVAITIWPFNNFASKSSVAAVQTEVDDLRRDTRDDLREIRGDVKKLLERR